MAGINRPRVRPRCESGLPDQCASPAPCLPSLPTRGHTDSCPAYPSLGPAPSAAITAPISKEKFTSRPPAPRTVVPSPPPTASLPNPSDTTQGPLPAPWLAWHPSWTRAVLSPGSLAFLLPAPSPVLPAASTRGRRRAHGLRVSPHSRSSPEPLRAPGDAPALQGKAQVPWPSRPCMTCPVPSALTSLCPSATPFQLHQAALPQGLCTDFTQQWLCSECLATPTLTTRLLLQPSPSPPPAHPFPPRGFVCQIPLHFPEPEKHEEHPGPESMPAG